MRRYDWYRYDELCIDIKRLKQRFGRIGKAVSWHSKRRIPYLHKVVIKNACSVMTEQASFMTIFKR